VEKQQLLVIIPLGIPGMGKSTIVHVLKYLMEQNHFEFKVLSADALRFEMMKNWMDKNNSRDETRAFEGTQKN